MGLPMSPYLLLIQKGLGSVNPFSVSIGVVLVMITISLSFVLAKLLGFL